jgi:predicted glutamine amidotransferase
MCRLLGYSATATATFNEVVGKEFDQFVSLAKDHCDGWGIASSAGSQIDTVKEPIAATKSDAFNKEVLSHKSNAALLHLRWATEGMPVTQNNTHPFTYHDISFIHNGSITPSNALDQVIDKKYLQLAKGTTDSERYFLFLLSQIEKHGFVDGVKAALTYLKDNCTYSSINMMIINPDYFITACIYNQDKIPKRFANDLDYYQLKFRAKDGNVVVASSGWNQDGWQQIPNGSILVVARSGQKYSLCAL